MFRLLSISLFGFALFCILCKLYIFFLYFCASVLWICNLYFILCISVFFLNVQIICFIRLSMILHPLLAKKVRLNVLLFVIDCFVLTVFDYFVAVVLNILNNLNHI